jgi:hypothetical protein
MNQSCPVVHKSRRPQARLQTAKLFCNNCVSVSMMCMAEISQEKQVSFLNADEQVGNLFESQKWNENNWQKVALGEKDRRTHEIPSCIHGRQGGGGSAIFGGRYSGAHDYYSIWFNFIAAFFRSENKVRDIKLKTHYFISYHVMK